MALITSDDIALLLGVTYSGDDEDRVNLWIDLAIGELEAWLGRPIQVESFTEVVIADADGRVFLSNTPVVSISSVEVDGTTLDPDSYTVTPWGLEGMWPRNQYGVIDYGLDDYDDFDDPEITVEYTAGLDEPNGVNSVIAFGVMRLWGEAEARAATQANEVTGIEEMRVEDYSLKFYDGDTFQSSSYGSGANPLTVFRSDKDFNSIKRYKKRVSA